MKKIYQFGFIAMLIALLPTGVIFAGDGSGKGKTNTIQISPESGSRSITLMVTTDVLIEPSTVSVNSQTPGATIKEIIPVVGGMKVLIDVDPDIVYSVGFEEPIVITIVGVDNITGVGANDGNTGSDFNTNIAIAENEDNSDDENGGGQNNGTGSISNSNAHDNVAPAITGNGHGGKSEIAIFPNPVIDETNVVTVGEILGKSIQVMDLTGHVVMNMIVGHNSRQTVLNLSGLTPGLYILNYTLENGQVISKRIQKV